MQREAGTSTRKRPAQARSRAMMEGILDAAARVLVTGGYEAFTTNRVAQVAGASVGSLYQYFPNKAALLAELMRRHAEEVMREMNEAAARSIGAPFPEMILAMVQANVKGHGVDPDLHRALSEEVPRLGPQDWRIDFQARAVAQVRALLERHRAEIVVEDLGLAAFVLSHTVDSVVHAAVADRPDDLASGVLAAELAQMITRYLTAAPASSGASASSRVIQ